MFLAVGSKGQKGVSASWRNTIHGFCQGFGCYRLGSVLRGKQSYDQDCLPCFIHIFTSVSLSVNVCNHSVLYLNCTVTIVCNPRFSNTPGVQDIRFKTLIRLKKWIRVANLRFWGNLRCEIANHAIMFSIKLVKDALRGFQRGWALETQIFLSRFLAGFFKLKSHWLIIIIHVCDQSGGGSTRYTEWPPRGRRRPRAGEGRAPGLPYN